MWRAEERSGIFRFLTWQTLRQSFWFFRLFGPTTRTDLWPLGLLNLTVRTVWTDSANPWPSPLIGLLFEPKPSNDIHHDLQFLWQINS
jgi:hypothetical protein